MTMVRKVLALLLTLVMLLSLFPAALAAEEIEEEPAAQALAQADGQEDAAPETEVEALTEQEDPAGEPVAEEPAAEEPVAEEPAAEEPAAEEPAAEEPAEEEPAAEEPAEEEPAVEESAEEEPAAQAPVEEVPLAIAAEEVEESVHSEAAMESVSGAGTVQKRARSGGGFSDPIVIKTGETVKNAFPIVSGTYTDYYKLALESSGTVTLVGTSDAGKVHLSLCNSKKTEVWSDDIDLTEKLTLELTRDTYYLVFSNLDSRYGDYAFRLAFTSAGETVAESGGGSNNTKDKASKMSTNTRMVGQLSITDAEDWYTFTLSKSGRLTFASATAMEEIAFELLDKNGNVIWSEVSESNHSTGENKISNLIADVTAGTYYLNVQQMSGGMGRYLFQINYTASNETFTEAPGGSNNTLATANVVNANTIYNGQLAENDSVDLYKFTVSDDKASISFQASTKLPKVNYIFCNKSGTALKTIASKWTSASSPGTVKESVPLTKGTYYLKVQAPGGYTGNYSFKLQTSAMFVPVIKSLSNGNGSITIKWDSNGAVRYRVFVKKDGKWTTVGDTTTTSYTFKKPVGGTTYQFTIRSVSKDGKKYVSGYDATGAKITYIAPPTIRELVPVYAGMQVAWKAEPGAVNYKVFYREPKGKWIAAGTTTGTKLVVRKLKNNVKYDFTVRAFTADGKKAVSAYRDPGQTKLYLTAPELTSLAVVNEGLKIEWKQKEGAAKYRIFYKTAGGKWTKTGETDKTSFTIKGLAKGQKYTVTVRCISKDGKVTDSGYDTKGLSTDYLSTPVITSVTQDSAGVKIEWTPVVGAPKYRVYAQVGGKGDFKVIGTATTNTFTLTEPKAKTKYTFRVRCLSADGKSFTSGYDVTGRTLTTK